MAISSARPDVLLVPLIDVNWLVYAPFDPGRDFRVDPPKVEQSVGETRGLCRLLKDMTGGKYILSPHSGTYCRTGYYDGEMLDVYREAVADGAELSVHLHEEIKGAGTRYMERDHVTAVYLDCKRRLENAGIRPVAYRGGHYAYTPFMNELLPQTGIVIDCSCSPGGNHPDREAIWVHAETTGYYLPMNPRLPAAGQVRSKVFEIPIGCDGEGAAYKNLLHVEQSELYNLQRVWGVIRERARRSGQPQIVHSLFHTGSVGKPEWIERFKRFLAFVPDNGGEFVTTVEAKAAFDANLKENAA
ncbi:MAG: hypothetical protein HXX10_05950 [Rhodoplanes sp.]|uniref:hypothetical protein n=1 Tax=Rhodoplanes sp. TaxID=1968906 RepID=UPI001842486C|nr:hypothetical protein [Rhodoplanes sp.]NVO13564.1 hypothetical protein [Rhodoplanes sp.]